jgi:acetyl esterase/lipase
VRPYAATATLTALLFLTPNAGAAGQPRVIEGLTYASPGGHPLHLDAYLPSDPAPAPGVIVLHGGAWSEGSRQDAGFVGRWLSERGLAAFVIDYRLAPRQPFPAAVRDAQAAVRWVRANARSYGVIPSHLSAFGVSAGGHLAAMLGVLGRGSLDRGARVRVAVSWSGPMDLVGLLAETRGEAADVVEPFVGCTTCVDRLRAASPINHVDGSDAAVLLVASSTEALPFGQTVRMGEVLEAEGVPHRVVEIPGSLHAEGFAYMPLEGRTVLDATVAYLTDQVQRRAPAGPPLDLDLRLFLLLAAMFLLGAAMRAALVPALPLHQAEVS